LAKNNYANQRAQGDKPFKRFKQPTGWQNTSLIIIWHRFVSMHSFVGLYCTKVSYCTWLSGRSTASTVAECLHLLAYCWFHSVRRLRECEKGNVSYWPDHRRRFHGAL
jgi:hypothetical protein